MKINHPLKPIYNKSSKILILGSMPSKKSRELNFYYANPTNRFWKILEIIFKTTLNTQEEKETFLLNNYIALFDVFKSVDIIASNDASIKNYKLNNLTDILNDSNIKAIFITGKTAYNAFIKHYNLNIPIIYLPSPSSANATYSLKKLVEHYKIILEFL